MHVRRRVLDAAQRERLDRPVPGFPQAVNHRRLEKALDLEIVHQVIGVVGRGVADTALALAEEDLLPAQLSGSGLAWIELSEHVELRCRREPQHLLELGHDVDLMAALENVYALLRRDHIFTVEIGAPLLEFGEILNRFERALRAKQPLNEHASQSGGGDAMAGLRRTSIGRKMRRPVGMTVRVAIQAAHAPARLLRAAILGLVELLLRK